MSIHINKFIDSVKAHESRNQKDFVMSLRDAKDLLADIAKLLLSLEQLRTSRNTQPEVAVIEINGGDFKKNS